MWHALLRRHLHGQGFEEGDAIAAGGWAELGEDGSQWRLALHSPGAQSHVLIFRCLLEHV